jgi:hypothetical protein
VLEAVLADCHNRAQVQHPRSSPTMTEHRARLKARSSNLKARSFNLIARPFIINGSPPIGVRCRNARAVRAAARTFLMLLEHKYQSSDGTCGRNESKEPQNGEKCPA